MQIVDSYKALVIKELPKNGIAIYVCIGYDSWVTPEFHYSNLPLLHPFETTMEDILAPYKKSSNDEFIKNFYAWHKLVDVQLIMKHQQD